MIPVSLLFETRTRRPGDFKCACICERQTRLLINGVELPLLKEKYLQMSSYLTQGNHAVT